MIKRVADKANGRIIGVHDLADHMDTLIGTGVMRVAGEMKQPSTTSRSAAGGANGSARKRASYRLCPLMRRGSRGARRWLNRLRRTAKKQAFAAPATRAAIAALVAGAPAMPVSSRSTRN